MHFWHTAVRLRFTHCSHCFFMRARCRALWRVCLFWLLSPRSFAAVNPSARPALDQPCVRIYSAGRASPVLLHCPHLVGLLCARRCLLLLGSSSGRCTCLSRQQQSPLLIPSGSVNDCTQCGWDKAAGQAAAPSHAALGGPALPPPPGWRAPHPPSFKLHCLPRAPTIPIERNARLRAPSRSPSARSLSPPPACSSPAALRLRQTHAATTGAPTTIQRAPEKASAAARGDCGSRRQQRRRRSRCARQRQPSGRGGGRGSAAGEAAAAQ